MKKAPAGGDQAGDSCRTGAGELEARKRPALVKFEPNNFLRLYQTAQAPAVDKGELCLRAGRGRQSQSEQARGV
jgi:hypothetical protein